MAAGAQLLIGMIPLALIALLTETPSDVTWSLKFVLILFSFGLTMGIAFYGEALTVSIALGALLALLGILLVNRGDDTSPATDDLPSTKTRLDTTTT